MEEGKNNKVVMYIQLNENADNVQKVMVNDIEFNPNAISSEDVIQFHNTELLNYLKSINRIDYLNIVIQNRMAADCLPILSLYADTKIDIMVHGIMFNKDLLYIQVNQY